MFAKVSLKESSSSQDNSDATLENEFDITSFEDLNTETSSENEISKKIEKKKLKKTITVGDSLPYGIRLFYGSPENIVRIKDIGVKKRILVLGVIGSFTPYCWNRHLFRVLQKIQYYEERYIDYICCISTNDPFTQRAWAIYLGCDETVLMFSDKTKRFTQAIGMDIVVPWLDNQIRSKRYVIYAEDMVVIKMITAPMDGTKLNWECEHLLEEQEIEEDLSSDSDI